MRAGLRCFILMLCGCGAWAQTMRGAVVREFPFPVPTVKAALENVGAYKGSRLPSLEGFANVDRVNLKDYQRPYYEFKIEIEPKGQNHTEVQVKANVSAWYTGPDSHEPGYRALESNGRLENDLLDRLSDYLRDKSADAATLAQWIAAARQERIASERHTAELEGQMKTMENPRGADAEYVAVERPRVAVLAGPSDMSAVVLKAQLEDEFQVLERRGAWLRVKLDNDRDGWVRASQIEADDAANPAGGGKKPEPASGFEVIRENTDAFAGDWQRLKGKKALYLWVRPDGTAMNLPTASRLQFVQNLFRDRYREMVHSSANSAEGIVVIFMDQRGGVAAASVDDIRSWMEGALSPAAFLKKCSLDPPGAFQDASSAQPTPGARRSHS